MFITSIMSTDVTLHRLSKATRLGVDPISGPIHNPNVSGIMVPRYRFSSLNKLLLQYHEAGRHGDRLLIKVFCAGVSVRNISVDMHNGIFENKVFNPIGFVDNSSL